MGGSEAVVLEAATPSQQARGVWVTRRVSCAGIFVPELCPASVRRGLPHNGGTRATRLAACGRLSSGRQSRRQDPLGSSAGQVAGKHGLTSAGCLWLRCSQLRVYKHEASSAQKAGGKLAQWLCREVWMLLTSDSAGNTARASFLKISHFVVQLTQKYAGMCKLNTDII